MGMGYVNQGAVTRPPARHRVYMSFFVRHGWQVQFMEADLKTVLPRLLVFAESDKLLEIFERWGVDRKMEDRSAFEYAIRVGRGGIYLDLSHEEYLKLRIGRGSATSAPPSNRKLR